MFALVYQANSQVPSTDHGPASEGDARIGFMTAETDAYVPGQLVTRVAGRARSQTAAMREFDQGVTELRGRMNPALWPLFIPAAKDIYRWRIRLECGCTHELFVSGEGRFPDERRFEDPITQARLPAGEFWCFGEHPDAPKAYRDIVEWLERKEREFPADPEEPEYEGMDAETWAQIRHAEPHSSAFWRVRLDCGHIYDSVVTDLDWRPDDGPKLTTPERAEEMRRELEALWTADHTGWPEIGPERDHVVKMLELRWPRPEPEQDCYACRHARRMTGYQLIGPLLAPEKPQPPTKTKREMTQARLAAAEAEVRRLRAELRSADEA